MPSVRTTVATFLVRYLDRYRSARSRERDFVDRPLCNWQQHVENVGREDVERDDPVTVDT